MLTDSGTSALTLAIKVAVPRNDVVALPAWGCYDLATAAEGADVNVVLYDVDPATLAPDQASLQRALEAGARAVVLAHFYGVPVDIDRIRDAAADADATLIEDAAQAIGGSWRGRPLGALGALGILSFGRGKGLNGGGGGALLLNRSQASSRTLSDAHAGWGEVLRATAQWLLARPAIYALPAALPFLKLGETVYHAPDAPRALSRASAAMVQANWQHAHAAAGIRRRNARRLMDAVRPDSKWQTIVVPQGGEAGYLRLPLVAGSARDETALADGARLGIMPGYPETLLSLAQMRARCVNAADRFDGAETLARSLVTLPTHELLTPADLQGLEAWLKRY